MEATYDGKSQQAQASPPVADKVLEEDDQVLTPKGLVIAIAEVQWAGTFLWLTQSVNQLLSIPAFESPACQQR